MQGRNDDGDMSTDIDLLKSAAKAAGMRIQRTRMDDKFHRDFLMDGEGIRNLGQKAFPWNPLTDDGDALRLAVRLRLSIDIERDRCCTTMRSPEGRIGVQPWGADGAEAATRRAIVRAAASIGEAMP